MNDFKQHMITDHKKDAHAWWSEEIKAEFYCDECESEFTMKTLLISHMEAIHGGDIPNTEKEASTLLGKVKSEFYDIKNYPEVRNEPEDEDIDKAYGKKKEQEQMGIIMKGKSQTFKDANVVLKSKLKKMFKDTKGREFKVLNVLSDDTIELEVKTLSQKPQGTRGQ